MPLRLGSSLQVLPRSPDDFLCTVINHSTYTCVVAMQLVLNEQRLRVDNQILRAQQGLHPFEPAHQQDGVDSNVRPQQRDL